MHFESKIKPFESIFEIHASKIRVSLKIRFGMMKKILSIIAALILGASVSTGQKLSQPYTFKNIRIEKGLTSNTIQNGLQDSRGFIWICTKDGICRYNGSYAEIFDNDNYGLMSGRANAICEDRDGLIWFSTSHSNGWYDPETDRTGELFCSDTPIFCIKADLDGNIWFASTSVIIRYNKGTKEISRYPASLTNTIQTGAVNQDGEVWFTSLNGNLLHFSKQEDRFEELSIFSEEEKKSGACLTNIVPLGDGRLLASSNDGRVMKIDPTTGTSVTIARIPDRVRIKCLYVKDAGEYWLGSRQGLLICNSTDGLTKIIDGTEANSISDKSITCIFPDTEGNTWIGTSHGGMDICPTAGNRIIQLFTHTESNAIFGNVVQTINRDLSGNLWVGTEDSGLIRQMAGSNTIQDLSVLNNLPAMSYHCSLLAGQTMWMGTYRHGICVFNTGSGLLESRIDVPEGNCTVLYRTSDGSIYAGGFWGLAVYDAESGGFARIKEIDGMYVRALFEDSYHTLWVGTYGKGLWYRKENSRPFKHIPGTDEDKEGLRSEFVTSIFEDSAQNLYVATEGAGIAVSKIGSVTDFTYLNKKSGLLSDNGCTLAQDRSGKIWIGTSLGLVRYNPQSGLIEKAYVDNNGKGSNSFCYGACYQSPEGIIRMGTYSGMVEFDPASIVDYSEKAPLYITGIYCNDGQDVKRMTSEGKSAMFSDFITIDRKNAGIISFRFAAPCYSILSKLCYEYSLASSSGPKAGYITSENSVSFSALRPGRYTFNVRLIGSSSPEASKEIQIRIPEPFYASTAAIILYVLLSCFFSCAILYQLRKRSKNKEALKLAMLESAKQMEIYESKINFFTDITHEVRTPLTLIKMPIEKIIAEKEYTEASKEDLLTIKANTDRLLNLTNQLLDIKKIEKGNVKVRLAETDICLLAGKVSDYFKTAMKERNVKYEIMIPEKTMNIVTDPDFVEKILCNLLSNAVKYSKDATQLILDTCADAGKVIIKVNSNGDILSQTDAENIFKPFYQIKTVNSHITGHNGTGLGLPYAAGLAQTLGGRLYLDTSGNVWNSFVVELPLKSGTEEAEDVSAVSHDPSPSRDLARHQILVVEDSEDMNKYICKELAKDYGVLSASNGKAALEVLGSQKVDLVVSDIMMPVMDGCQLCNNIKKNLEFSHIPVILVSAAVGVETRIETLEVGADGYIEKPFSIELLKANIANLFKNREIAYNQFANSPLAHFNSTVVNRIDQDFMDELHNTVMESIADQDLNIESLTMLMHTSKSTLYRKVKANTGLNINEYIKICRLKKAAELLATNKHRINEVAYLTGFSSPSYFATSFQKQFQISPSAFVKNLGGKS